MGIPFAADPSQQLARMDGAPIAPPDRRRRRYLFTNDYEWELLQSKTGWTEADDRCSASASGSPPSARRASRSSAADGTGCTSARCRRHAKIDPTGVGDGFRAGFLAGRRRRAVAGAVGAARLADRDPVLETVGPQEYAGRASASWSGSADAYGADAAAEIAAVVPA